MNTDYRELLARGWQELAEPAIGDRIVDQIEVSNEGLAKTSAKAVRLMERYNRLGRHRLLYRRAGQLARVTLDEQRPVIEPCGMDHVRWVLARVAHFVKTTKNGETVVPPPLDVVRDILVTPELPFPPLAGVTEIPALREDGSVLVDEGYDPETRLTYLPSDDLHLPEDLHGFLSPTDFEVQRALQLIYGELLVDFIFETTADRANALALLLTPIVRPAVAGPVPLALVDAPMMGTGKGLFANQVSLISEGRDADTQPLDVSESEVRKVIMSTLVKGSPIVLLDNVDEPIRSPSLASVLTTTSYTDRILGKTEMVTVPNQATWIATGNNLRVGGDLARRCYRIRIDSNCARPWEREGFRHPDLSAWTRESRGELVAALLTLAMRWYDLGCPAPTNLSSFGSFGSWTKVVGGVLQHVCGETDFLGNRDVIYQELDVESAEWETLLTGLKGLFGDAPFTAKDVQDRLPWLGGYMPGSLEDASTKAVGKAFASKAGRYFGDQQIKIVRVGSVSGTASWMVVNGSAP